MNGISIAEFEKVYKEKFSNLYLFAYDIVGDYDTAKDIVNDVFCKLWGKHEQLNTDKIDGLVFISVKNECFNHIRKQKKISEYESWVVRNAISIDSIEALETQNESIDEMMNQIEKLPYKTRVILKECYLNGHTYKEVAEIMQISTESVKKHIMKAYSALRVHFKVKKE